MASHSVSAVSLGALALLLLLSVSLLGSIGSVSALSVTPVRHQLNNPSPQVYQYVYAVTNSEPQPRTITIQLEPTSEYLASKVSFSKEQFSLLPGATENIQLSFNPSGLGPETHTLQAGLYSGNERIGMIELLVIVPGTPVENYDIGVDVEDTTTQNLVPVDVTLSNYGNVIGYARLRLDILDSGSVAGTVDYPELIQVVPGEKKNFHLTYTDTLKPGFYAARVNATYPSRSIAAEKRFSVTLQTTKEIIDAGSDLELTFASLGNPPAVAYSLTDSLGKERAAGTFLPSQGDLVVPMAALPAGTYSLSLTMRGVSRSITVVVRDKYGYARTVVFALTGLIVLVALFSLRHAFALRLRLWRLTRAVARREREVTNLINRAHRLVDEYASYAARRHQADRSVGASGQGPR